jgi:hypothetical protein
VEQQLAVSQALNSALTDVPAAPLRLVVPVAAGALLTRELFGTSGTSHRIVTLGLDRARLGADISAGTEVDVLAATGGPPPRLAVVGTARVVSLGPPGDRAAPRQGQAGAVRPDDSVSVQLDADAATAMRLIWVDDFARDVRVLVHPGGGTPLVTLESLP